MLVPLAFLTSLTDQHRYFANLLLCCFELMNTLRMIYLSLSGFRSSKLLRAFYVPVLSERYTQYANYTILKSRRSKQTKRKMGG